MTPTAGPAPPTRGSRWVASRGETSRIRLGTLVTSATFRLPGLLAVQVAQVDAMSNGRVELGLGAGWYDDEHRAYGVPFPSVGERFERLEEQLAIVTGLWSTPDGEKFSFAGSHYELADSPALPKPVQQPIPIVIGGYGTKRTPRLAGEVRARVQSAVPAARLLRHRVRHRARRVREERSRPADDGVVGGARGVLR